MWVCSPGKPLPYRDANGQTVPGSLSEKIFIPINGVEQGMFIQSRDPSNPVLLYLHGGMPDYFLTEKYPTGLDEYFTVVWWEQRGSGMSYNPDIPLESMTLEQYIEDTITITNYLRERFGQDKIYLMGHSGGTFIGIHAAARAPELYHAYIGMAQMSYQLESEKLAYDYMLAEFRKMGDEQMVRKLEAAPVTLENGTPDGYRKIRDLGMHSLGIGTMHDMKTVEGGIFLPSLASPQYTLKEKLNTWMGKSKAGVSILWD
jgi:pimeloyl-ACP methyl ester carboxylesterase